MEDEHGQTAVMESTENRAIDVVRNLVEDCSANVNSTAVRMAADCGYIDIQRILTPFLLAVASETTKDGEDFVLSPGIPSRCFIPPSEIELTLFHENGSIGGDFLAKWLDSDVAVKLFIPDAFSTSFEDEVRLWQQLRHPNVLKMYGACYAGAHLKFFVCEFASNGSLLEHVNSSSVGKRTMWKYLYEAALGLEYLHERGIVHAELRCSNILIGSDGTAKLADFRLSGLRSSARTHTAGRCARISVGHMPSRPRLRPSLSSVVFKLGNVAIKESYASNQPENEPVSSFDECNMKVAWLKLETLMAKPNNVQYHREFAELKKTVEERSAFLKILTKEMETVGKYRPDQLEVMKKTYRDIASKLEGNDWSELAPALFIPWYELVVGKWSKLGEGSFGSVHRAKWLDSDVVVKRVILAGSTGTANVSTTYSSFSASEDPSATQVQDDTAKRADACAMFRREVDIWFGFSHPHVVRLFGACHIGRPFFVCEYATNGTLVSYLRKSPDELWSKLHEAALGVQYLHARGVIHGDLKGNNIVVGSNVKAKVTDFGLSSVGDSEENTLVSGAWKWVAPELLDTNQVPTLASDVSLRSGSRPRRSSMSWRS
ncbi:hypothetical protein PF005_g13122 [Phytophthora fragariae]|uniref:Protein kinase domain-containing protein n=2 Tax=Phytophthora fragariae TaxID=53985 RepID=A0A6A3XRX9_9STRA|nr:hypothetical protein PF010_g14667 [Phytophthora fragariae]KAE9206152.1 hypothetical protein PF005_g13122 [Phytophthora fragariae]